MPRSIVSINLSENSIGPGGVSGIIPLFDSKKFSLLHKLNIENNHISDSGLKIILPSILSNMSINSLNLSNNHISDCSSQFLL